MELEIGFQTESARTGTSAAFTRLSFEEVVEYRWIASNQSYFRPTAERMLDEGMYADRPPGQRLGGTVDETRLRHYRIGFDNYGSFNVICLGFRVERFRTVS